MTEAIDIRLIRSFAHAELLCVPGQPTLVVRATAEFVPFAEFQSIFEAAAEVIRQENITQLVFDKRSLRVFDPESMEWYFTQWKEAMYDLGLRTHYKIMPENIPFKYGVDLTRQRIFEQYPNARFHRMNIRYVASVEEALRSSQ